MPRQKSVVDVLKDEFLQKTVLDIQGVCKVVGTRSRITAYRYLGKIGALSSYSHAGKYYALKNAISFDEYGLWHYGEIGFSQYGTLMDTLPHLISACEAGKSSLELEQQQKVYVQNALLTLVKAKKIDREKINGVYIYTSTDPNKKSGQLSLREHQAEIPCLPDWMVVQILVCAIKCLSACATPKEVSMLLKKQGSSIKEEHVTYVFHKYSLEKKTLELGP